MRISDWSSDVCSSDLDDRNGHVLKTLIPPPRGHHDVIQRRPLQSQWLTSCHAARITILRKSRRRKRHGSGSHGSARYGGHEMITHIPSPECASFPKLLIFLRCRASGGGLIPPPCVRNSYSACLSSEDHTSELQSLMRISYAVFCLKKKTETNTHQTKK